MLWEIVSLRSWDMSFYFGVVTEVKECEMNWKWQN